MEKLSMCRICLGENIRLKSIVETHLQEIYETLVMVPFETKDIRPIQVCYICRARLQNCYELRRCCLRSEEILKQMLSSDELKPLKMNEEVKQKLTEEHNVVNYSFGDEETSDDEHMEAMMFVDVKVEPETDSEDESCMESEVTSSNLQHQLVQDKIKEVNKVTAADKTAATSTNEVTFTLNDNNKERCTSVPYTIPITSQPCYTSKCEKRRDIPLSSKRYNKDVPGEDSANIQSTHKPHQCTICEKRFAYQSILNIYMRTHTGEKPYHCEMCKLQFSQKSALTKHMRIHTGVTVFPCEVCKTEFLKKSEFKKHMRTHTGDKPYQCDICKVEFAQPSIYKEHMRIHTGERPFLCDICNKQFLRKSHLTAHTRIHTGEKPYSCDLCSIQFSQNSDLTKHMRVHTGEKPFPCDVCLRQFSRKSILTEHRRTHTGEKPFHCDICLKQFSRRTYLNYHIRYTHS